VSTAADASPFSDYRIELLDAVAVLATLGHKLRLELWAMLVPYGPSGLSAGSIAARLAIAPSSLSFHLQQMTQAGILVQRRSSRRIIYSANNEVIASLCAFLAISAGSAIQTPETELSSAPSGDIVSEG
jgi:ArsR family transcriptional regulator, arsenate/arsenite/antimonite-responsive transcriptional repressor